MRVEGSGLRVEVFERSGFHSVLEILTVGEFPASFPQGNICLERNGVWGLGVVTPVELADRGFASTGALLPEVLKQPAQRCLGPAQ